MNKLQEFNHSLKTLNPNEVHNWPMPVKVFMAFGAAVAILLAGSMFHLKGYYEELNLEISKEEKLKQEFINKKTVSINVDLYKEQLEQVTNASDTLLKQLPNKSEMDKLLLDINQAAVSRQLEVILFKPSKETMKEFYAELPIVMTLSGDYDSIGKFVEDVSKLSRVVLLENFEIKNNEKVNLNVKGKNFLKMDVTAKTFRYLDADELEKQKQEKLRAEKEKKGKKNDKK